LKRSKEPKAGWEEKFGVEVGEKGRENVGTGLVYKPL